MLDWVKLPPEKRSVKTEVIKRPQPKRAQPRTLSIQRNRLNPNPKPVEVRIASRESLVFVRENLDMSLATPQSGVRNLKTEANIPVKPHTIEIQEADGETGSGNEGLLIGTVQEPSSGKGRSSNLSTSVIDSTGAVDSPDSEDTDYSGREFVPKKKLGAILTGDGPDLRGHIRIVRLKHSLSDWWQDPTAMPSLFKWLTENTPIRADMKFKGGSLRLTDPDIQDAPLIFMTGHDKDITVGRSLNKDGPLSEGFSAEERAALRTYIIDRSGMLFFDDCGFNGLFAQQVALELDKTFPEYPLKDIPHNHEIYNVYYQLPIPPRGGDVFWSAPGAAQGAGGVYRPISSKFAYQKGISIGSRLAVIYNRKDYMCSMETAEVDSRARLRDRRSPDVHRFMTNLFVYAMKYGGNTDRSDYKR